MGWFPVQVVAEGLLFNVARKAWLQAPTGESESGLNRVVKTVELVLITPSDATVNYFLESSRTAEYDVVAFPKLEHLDAFANARRKPSSTPAAKDNLGGIGVLSARFYAKASEDETPGLPFQDVHSHHAALAEKHGKSFDALQDPFVKIISAQSNFKAGKKPDELPVDLARSYSHWRKHCFRQVFRLAEKLGYNVVVNASSPEWTKSAQADLLKEAKLAGMNDFTDEPFLILRRR